MSWDPERLKRLLDKLEVLRDERDDKSIAYIKDRMKKLGPEDRERVGLEKIIEILGYVKALQNWYALIDEQDVSRPNWSINGAEPKKVRNVCTLFLQTIGFYFVKTRRNGNDTVVLDGEIGYKVQNNPDAHVLCISFAKLIQNQDIYYWTLDLQQAFNVTDPKKIRITLQTPQQQAASIMKTAVNGISSCIQDFKDLNIPT